MSKGATLKEIAQLTGFAVSTISKALRDSSEISPDSKAKIKEVANMLNFKPNRHALSLSLGKNYCIAVIIPRQALIV